jgi:uncharacterized protein HemX
MKNSMDLTAFTDHVDKLIAVAGAGGASWLSYRQGQKNAKTIELDNSQKINETYKELADYLKENMKEFQGEIKLLKDNHEECEKSKKELTDKVNELEKVMHNIIQTPIEKRKYTKGKGSANSNQ